jgi:hypothetical protein
MHWCDEFGDDQEVEWSRKPSRTWDFSTIARATARLLGRGSARCQIIVTSRVYWSRRTSLHLSQHTTISTAIMDWNDLRNQVSNLSVYDLKAGVRKVQNGMYTGVTGSWA